MAADGGRGSHLLGSGCPPASFAGFGNGGRRRDKSNQLHHNIFLRLLWTWDIGGGVEAARLEERERLLVSSTLLRILSR